MGRRLTLISELRAELVCLALNGRALSPRRLIQHRGIPQGGPVQLHKKVKRLVRRLQRQGGPSRINREGMPARRANICWASR